MHRLLLQAKYSAEHVLFAEISITTNKYQNNEDMDYVDSKN